MSTSVFETSWRKVIGSFRSSQGHLLPPNIKEQLFEYITKGTIPPKPLASLLVADYQEAFSSVQNPLEAQRLHAIWEFLSTRMPTSYWRNSHRVGMQSFLAATFPGMQKQYEIALKERLHQEATRPIVID
jgi:hypothetical protein